MNKKILLFILLLITGYSFAGQTLIINNIKIPETPPVAREMVAYMNIQNPTKQTLSINYISSPLFKSVEIHETTHKNGTMHMRRIKILSIKPGQTVKLQPGGLHVMLIKPAYPLQNGDKIELTMQLNDKSVIELWAYVTNRNQNNTQYKH